MKKLIAIIALTAAAGCEGNFMNDQTHLESDVKIDKEDRKLIPWGCIKAGHVYSPVWIGKCIYAIHLTSLCTCHNTKDN